MMWVNCKPCFNTQPPEGGWAKRAEQTIKADRVSTHSRPKAAGGYPACFKVCINVSTHSRPKAAGFEYAYGQRLMLGFNTQPPEGGWVPFLSIFTA